MSRTRQLLTQITCICQEIRSIKSISSTKGILRKSSTVDKGTRPRADKREKDGRGCKYSWGNKTYAHYRGQDDNPDNPSRHACTLPSPPPQLPPLSPGSASVHTSSSSSSSASSTSTATVTSCRLGDTAGEIGERESFSQNETKDSEVLAESGVLGSRGGMEGEPRNLGPSSIRTERPPESPNESSSKEETAVVSHPMTPTMGHSQHPQLIVR